MKPNPRYANGHRRRQLRARVIAEEMLCGICGGEVNKDLLTPHPLSPEVDEIVPIAQGGSPFDRDNVQLAHRICNQCKGDGTGHQGYCLKCRRDGITDAVPGAAGEIAFVTLRCWWNPTDPKAAARRRPTRPGGAPLPTGG